MAFDPNTAQLDADPDADSLLGWMKTNSAGIKAAQRQAAAEGITAAFKGNDAPEAALREVLRHSAGVLPQAVRKGIRREWYRTHAKDKTSAPDITDFWAEQGPRLLNDRFVGRGSWRDQAKRWLRGAVDHVHRATGVRADAPLLKTIATTLDGGQHAANAGQ